MQKQNPNVWGVVTIVVGAGAATLGVAAFVATAQSGAPQSGAPGAGPSLGDIRQLLNLLVSGGGVLSVVWGYFKLYGKQVLDLADQKGGLQAAVSDPSLGAAVASVIYLREYLKGVPESPAKLDEVWTMIARKPVSP